MTFQDGEEVRDVPGPTNISHSHGEVSGQITRGSLQAGWVRCTQKSCLHPSPPTAGMGGSGLGSWSCLGPNEALSCVNLPEEHSLWGTTPDAGNVSGFGLMLSIVSVG